MKQLDAFEKMVYKMCGPRGTGLTTHEAATLIRQHHAKVVGMVRRTHNITVGALRKSILAKLKEMEGK